MEKIYILYFLLTSLVVGAFQPVGDSASTLPTIKPAGITVTTRVHTMGLFMYMGKVVNHNPAADLFLNVTTPTGWGISAFKVFDVNDIHSHNNFAFLFVHKAFQVGKRLTVAPWLGAGLEQQHAFVDHGSDVMLQLVSSLKLNQNFTVEHIALFNNVIFETLYADWTNRFRLIYSQGHVDVTGYFWHNNALIDDREYTSTGISVFYNRVPLGKRSWIGAGINTLATVGSSNPEKVPTTKGIQFTTAITFK